MSSADVNGTRLWYEVAGEGPAVVLLHHGIVDSRVWDEQWGPLSARYRVLRCDLRGFGRSPLPGGPFSYADDLLALMNVVGIESAAIVGASMGSNVELEAAQLAPERVRGLVIAPPGRVGGEQSEALRRYGEAEDAALDRGDLDEAVRLNLDVWVAGPRRALDAVPAGVVERVAAMQRRAFEVQVPAFEQDPPPAYEKRVDPIEDRLADITAPTLVIVGDEDVPDILEAADTITELVPDARQVVMRGTAHVPNLERPEEFNEIVLGFLADML